MSIRLVVSNTVTVRIKGSMTNEHGTPEPFDFSLICDRMDSDELREVAGDSDTLLVDVMAQRCKGWTHVLDEQRAPLPFSEELLRQLLKPVGMAGLAFQAYVKACGVKGQEKN